MVKRATIEKRRVSNTADNDDDAELVDRLQDELLIDEHNLDQELIGQPEKLYTIAQRLAIAISRRDAAKQALKEEEAHFALEFRNTARKEGDKFTEKEVSDETDIDDGVIAAKNTLRECEFIVANLTALKEAYKDRGYALARLVDLWLASYFESDAAVRKPQQRLKNDRAEKTQADIRRRLSDNSKPF